MGPATRYWLLQLPGTALVAAIAYGLWHRQWLNADEASAIVLLWTVKDALLYPLYRKAFTLGPGSFAKHGPVGRIGRVTRADGAWGVVAIGHEYWRARTVDAGELHIGDRIRVVGREGPVLRIERA